MTFAFAVIDTVWQEEPHLFDAQWEAQVRDMIAEAIDCESLFAEDLLSRGVAGLSRLQMRQYLEYVADQRLRMLKLTPRYNTRNPFALWSCRTFRS